MGKKHDSKLSLEVQFLGLSQVVSECLESGIGGMLLGESLFVHEVYFVSVRWNH